MLKKPWKQQKSSAMAATNFSEASINDSTWIPVLKDLLLDCWNRVVVLQCGGKKMRWLKKKILFQHHEVPGSRLQSPITIPSHSWVVYLQNSVDGKLTESELAHRNKSENAQNMFRVNKTSVTHWGPLHSLHTKKLERLQDTKSEKHKQCISILLYSHVVFHWFWMLEEGVPCFSLGHFLKDSITQVVWDFEARLGKHLGIKQLQTLTAPFFFLTKYWLLFFFIFPRFLFALHGCRIFQVYKLLNIKMS